MEYQLYPLKDQSRMEELCALFAKGLADTTSEFWKWKLFSENGHPESIILVAEAEDGSLVGMFALQPVRYSCAGEERILIQLMDLVIDPNHRGSGLMKKLFRFAVDYYTAQGADGFITFCNNVSFPIFMKYGSRDAGDVYTINTKQSILPFYRQKELFRFDGWEIRLTDEMPKDLFFPEYRDGFGRMKNNAYMKWRFVDNPEGPFQWMTIRENGVLKGYLVLHIIQGRFRRAVNIYDWALQDEVSVEVLKKVVKLLRTHGNWVSLWGRYSRDVKERWTQAGLNNQGDQGTHFVLHQLGDEPLPEHWHLTRADLDY